MSELTPEELALARRLVSACLPALAAEERLVAERIVEVLTPMVCHPFISAVA